MFQQYELNNFLQSDDRSFEQLKKAAQEVCPEELQDYRKSILPDDELKAEEVIRGTFIEGTKHLKRRKERDEEEGNSKNNRYVKLGVALILLCIIFYYLVK